MLADDGLFGLFSRLYDSQREHEMSLEEYLEGCRNDPSLYASTAERMIAAIGEPEFVDTAKDARLGRIFMNRTLKVYPAFKDFYGLEETIERIVGFFRHAAQGLEEKKQILYLLGPVGGGKSSLADRLKDLMEKCPVYVLGHQRRHQPDLRKPARPVRSASRWAPCWRTATASRSACCTGNMSPWAVKRLDEFGGDISKFSVVKLHPSQAAPDLRRQDRAGRREQPGHLGAGRQGRHPQARASSARTTPTPTPTRAASTARPRAFSSSSRCSRRR